MTETAEFGVVTARGSRRDDAGMTLVEVLVAVVILSLSVVATLAALTTLASTSGLTREQADVGAVVRSAIEYIKTNATNNAASTPGGYTPCTAFVAGTAPYPLTLGTLPETDAQSPTILQITTLTGTPATVLWNSSGTFTTCTSDPGLQLIEVGDSSKDGKVVEDQWVTISANETNE